MEAKITSAALKEHRAAQELLQLADESLQFPSPIWSGVLISFENASRAPTSALWGARRALEEIFTLLAADGRDVGGSRVLPRGEPAPVYVGGQHYCNVSKLVARLQNARFRVTGTATGAAFPGAAHGGGGPLLSRAGNATRARRRAARLARGAREEAKTARLACPGRNFPHPPPASCARCWAAGSTNVSVRCLVFWPVLLEELSVLAFAREPLRRVPAAAPLVWEADRAALRRTCRAFFVRMSRRKTTIPASLGVVCRRAPHPATVPRQLSRPQPACSYGTSPTRRSAEQNY